MSLIKGKLGLKPKLGLKRGEIEASDGFGGGYGAVLGVTGSFWGDWWLFWAILGFFGGDGAFFGGLPEHFWGCIVFF